MLATLRTDTLLPFISCARHLMKSMEDLPIVTLDDLVTEGKDVKDLLSVQFADKLLALVRSGNYTLVD